MDLKKILSLKNLEPLDTNNSSKINYHYSGTTQSDQQVFIKLSRERASIGPVEWQKELHQEYLKGILQQQYESQRRLSHKNLVSPIEGREVGGQFAVIYPFIDGITDEEYHKHLNTSRFLKPLAVILRVIDTLEYLAANGTQHGDFNSTNLLISKDEIAIIDHCSQLFQNNLRITDKEGIRNDFYALGTQIADWISGGWGRFDKGKEAAKWISPHTRKLLDYLLEAEECDPESVRKLASLSKFEKNCIFPVGCCGIFPIK